MNTTNTNTTNVSEEYKLLVAVKTGTPSERKQALDTFWKKYQPLIFKFKGQLFNIAKENHISKDYVTPLLEDYEYGFAEDFMNAVNTQELARLDHLKETWSIHYTMSGYLKRYNTKLIGHSVKLHKNEVSGDKIYSNTKSAGDEEGVSLFDTYEDNSYNPETVYNHNMESKVLKTAFKKAYKRFNDVQKSIWDTSVQNITDNSVKVFERDGYKGTSSRVSAKKNEVSATLSLSTKDLNSNLRAMKQIVSSEIRRANKEFNASVVW